MCDLEKYGRGSAFRVGESLIGWWRDQAFPYHRLAVLNLAAATCVCLGLPTCNFELEFGIGLTRNRGSYVYGWFIGNLGELLLV
eukprot:92350-Pelagomonas_calceolata.AAC.6